MTNYLVVWTLKRGILLPAEPIDEESQAILEQKRRIEESRRAERIIWQDEYKPKRREVA